MFFYSYLYGTILITWLLSQFIIASIERKKHKTISQTYRKFIKNANRKKDNHFVTVIVPFYNETIHDMQSTLYAVDSLYYKNYECIVWDDGSEDNGVYLKINRLYENNPKFKIIRSEKNMGKRHAHSQAFQYRNPKTKYIMTIDSDSTVSPRCLDEFMITASRYDADAVAGVILPKEGGGFLSTLLKVRYWGANYQERLSQSNFNQVNCCSGACALWRASMFSKIEGTYITQTFLGKKCTYGDDRHLTNLFMREGKVIKASPEAISFTTTPITLMKFFKQQLRWSKSFYRETIWSFTKIRKKLGWYFIYFNTVAFFLPFILFANATHVLFFRQLSWKVAVLYTFWMVFAALLRGAYAFWYTKDKIYFLSPIYGALHLFCVLPIRIFALTQLRDTRWGTR